MRRKRRADGGGTSLGLPFTVPPKILLGVVALLVVAGITATVVVTRHHRAEADKPAPAAKPPSQDDLTCRDLWGQLDDEVRQARAKGVDVKTAFADRWNTISAGIDYYAKTATAKQCPALLEQRRTTIEDTADLAAKALPYDPGQRLRAAQKQRAALQARAKPPKEPPGVRVAYKVLATKTPQASKDLAPAFAELADAAPDDAKAVKQALADIKLFSETSDADVACVRAMGFVDRWQKSLAKKPARTP